MAWANPINYNLNSNHKHSETQNKMSHAVKCTADEGTVWTVGSKSIRVCVQLDQSQSGCTAGSKSNRVGEQLDRSLSGCTVRSKSNKVGLKLDQSQTEWVYSWIKVKHSGWTVGSKSNTVGEQLDQSQTQWVNSWIKVKHSRWTVGSKSEWMYSWIKVQQSGCTAGSEQSRTTLHMQWCQAAVGNAAADPNYERERDRFRSAGVLSKKRSLALLTS